jgi:hypothetical protein
MSADCTLQGLQVDLLLSFLSEEEGAGKRAIERLLTAYPHTVDADIVRDAITAALDLLGEDVTFTVATWLLWTYGESLTELRNGLR